MTSPLFKRIEETVDNCLVLLADLRFYQATTAVLFWSVFILGWTRTVSFWWTAAILLAAFAAGLLNRWDERVKQRKNGAA